MKILRIWVVATVAAWSATASAEGTRPNIVLIVIDDLGRNDLGCYGSKYFKTPNLDKLASQGMRLIDGYAACPVCSPTRAALMTGKYPARLNLTDWLPGRGDLPAQKLARPSINQQLPLEETTLAELLRGVGYRTAHIGKWHLGGGDFSPKAQGFDINIAGDDRGSPPSYFAPFKPANGGSGKGYLPGLENAPDGEYLTDRLTTEAERFIDQSKDKPFFLYLAHYDVHTPMQAKKEYVDHYPPGPIAYGRQSNRIYAAKVESMDESVGRVMRKLDELNLASNTLVIFTSDNGGLATIEGPNTPPTFNAPLREGKGYLYEGGIRVPWIIRWPGRIKPGSTSSSPVSSQDVFPTIREIVGADPSSKVDGMSVLPVLKGETPPTRSLFWHYPHYANQGGKPGAAVREGEWKLIEFYEDGRRELFRVGRDLSESRNLIEEQPEIAARLARQLDEWRKSVGAKMMTPNPAHVPNPQEKDGTIRLPARWAEVRGVMLRYEPLPHKNTLGYWVNAKDHAVWTFTVTKPGTFVVQALQGCGPGNGGSEVDFIVGDRTLTLTVEDTGGFQAFKLREVGKVTINEPGRHTLTVKPRTKKHAAVMDLREVVLKPVE